MAVPAVVRSATRPGGECSGARLPSLTGLRFVAAALVFAAHASFVFPSRDPAVAGDFAHVAAQGGPVGVGFFFVLSGFVLTWTARRTDTAGRFWRRRAAKIFPNHLITWLAALILMIRAGQAVTAGTALPNLLLINSWVPKASWVNSMNDVSWSLACEAFFYLMFPLVHRLVARIPERCLWPSAAVVVAIVFILPSVALLLPDQPMFVFAPMRQLWFVYFLPPVRLLDFVLGCLMARIVRAGRWIPVGTFPAVLLAAVAYAVSLHTPPLYSAAAVMLVPLAFVVAAAADSDLRARRSLLRHRALVWLGEISFAFYMVHHLVIRFAGGALGLGGKWGIVAASAVVVAVCVVSVLVAWLLYALVERPAMRWSAGAGTDRVGVLVQPESPGETSTSSSRAWSNE